MKELRLRDICDMDTANAYLPQFFQEHNRKFAKAPQLEFDAHRSSEPFDLPLTSANATNAHLAKT